MSNCSNSFQDVFWIYKPQILFTSMELIPTSNMSLENKMNTLTRLFILIVIILQLLKVPNTSLFFFIGLLVIITLYLINYTMSTNTESFGPCFTDVDINNLSDFKYDPPPINNTRFNEPPPFIAPSHDLDEWKQSTLVQHSSINGNKGGYSLKDAGNILSDSTTAYSHNSPYYSCTKNNLPYRSCITNITNLYKCDEDEEDDITISPNKICTKNKIPVYKVKDVLSKTTCEKDCNKGKDGLINIKSDYCVSTPGDLIEHCGYNPDKGKLAGMPHNQPISINDYYPTLKEYHKNLNTQIIDPSGVYTTTEINEPQLTNMGISFAQQFQPIKKTYDKYGNEIYIRKDPRLYKPVEKVYDYGEFTPDSIYDPRTGGYGDDRRTYIHEITGQPRFYYDDINAARETNYITRNKIDIYNFTNQTGVFDKEINENPLEIVKSQAHDAYITNINEHRLSLQESLMRKMNERTRQQRLAPLRRDVPTRLMK